MLIIEEKKMSYMKTIHVVCFILKSQGGEKVPLLAHPLCVITIKNVVIFFSNAIGDRKKEPTTRRGLGSLIKSTVGADNRGQGGGCVHKPSERRRDEEVRVEHGHKPGARL